jgi:hypothetical protein
LGSCSQASPVGTVLAVPGLQGLINRNVTLCFWKSHAVGVILAEAWMGCVLCKDLRSRGSG